MWIVIHMIMTMRVQHILVHVPCGWTLHTNKQNLFLFALLTYFWPFPVGEQITHTKERLSQGDRQLTTILKQKAVKLNALHYKISLSLFLCFVYWLTCLARWMEEIWNKISTSVGSPPKLEWQESLELCLLPFRSWGQKGKSHFGDLVFLGGAALVIYIIYKSCLAPSAAPAAADADNSHRPRTDMGGDPPPAYGFRQEYMPGTSGSGKPLDLFCVAWLSFLT